MILALLIFSSLWEWNPTDPKNLKTNIRISHSLDADSPNIPHKATASEPPQYVSHEPISIDDDADFAAFNFPGDGSPENPYVIEGLNITSVSYPLIKIADITSYFRIQNNYLNGLTTGDTHNRWTYGISLSHVSYGTINNNTVTNSEFGIFLDFGINYNNISYNTITNCTLVGILLVHSSDTILSHNTLSNNNIGIDLSNSWNNTLFHNTISNYTYPRPTTGISISNSWQNTLINNHLINTGLNIHAGEIEWYFQTNVTGNVVNNRPLVYWQNVIGGTVPLGAGQVILINTTGVEVTGQFISQVTIGVFAAISSNLTIHHNTITNNLKGIHLRGTHLRYYGNNTLSHNTVANNMEGIQLVWSDNNTLSNNTISNSGPYGRSPAGIFLEDSNNNFISNNTLSNNTIGIFLDGSNNTVKWNDFLGNNPGGDSQVIDFGIDNDFTHNYWDDHDNTDLNGDGIADAPYMIEGNNYPQDNSPLATHANPPNVPETTIPSKVPGFEGFTMLVVIPIFLWLRRRFR